MIGHNYYHLWKGTTITSTSMIGHNYYHMWKGTALTSDLDSSERHNTYIHQHDRTQLLSSVKRNSTHIWPWLVRKAQHSHLTLTRQKGTTFTFTNMIVHSYYHLWKGTTLTSTNMIVNSYYHLWKGIALTSTSMTVHNYYHLWKGTALTSDLDSSERHSVLNWGFLVTDQVPPFREWQ